MHCQSENDPLAAEKSCLHAAGHSCTSVQWGAWGGVGMVAGSAAVLSRMARAGIGTVSPAAGLTALAGIVHAHEAPPLVSLLILSISFAGTFFVACHGNPQLILPWVWLTAGPLPACFWPITSCSRVQVSAVPFRWATFLRDARQARQPFYAALLPDRAAQVDAAAVQQKQTMAVAPASLSEAAVTAAVAEAVRAALGDGVSSGTPLLQAGLDSLGETFHLH